MTTNDGPSREGIPRPGDLWRTPVGCDEIAGWVILDGGGDDRGGSEDQELLVVSADGFARVGSRDVAVRETGDDPPLVLRCAWTARVRSSDLWYRDASGRVPDRILRRARAIVAEKEGEPRPSLLREHRDRSLAYEEWNDEVLATANHRLHEWAERALWCSRDAEKASPPEGRLLAGPGSIDGFALAAEGRGAVAESEAVYRQYLAQEPEIYDVDVGDSDLPGRLQVVASIEGALLRHRVKRDEESPRAFCFDHHGNRLFLTWSPATDWWESTPMPWDGDSIRVLIGRGPLLELWIRNP